jgi:hypothetical protein
MGNVRSSLIRDQPSSPPRPPSKSPLRCYSEMCDEFPSPASKPHKLSPVLVSPPGKHFCSKSRSFRSNSNALVVTDSLPHRPDDHNRTAKDTSLFCAQAKGKGDSRLLRGAPTDPVTLAINRLPRRTIRDIHPIRRLPRHHRWLRAQYSGNRPIYRHTC